MRHTIKITVLLLFISISVFAQQSNRIGYEVAYNINTFGKNNTLINSILGNLLIKSNSNNFNVGFGAGIGFSF